MGGEQLKALSIHPYYADKILYGEKTILEGACMDVVPYDSYAWILDNVRAIKPIPVKGKLSLWNFDGELEYFEPLDPDDDELDKRYHEVWEPLEYW